MSRYKRVFHADIPCIQCSKPFTPADRRQKYCFPCIEQSHTCVDCGAKKHPDVRGPRCKKCATLNSIDRPKPKNRRTEKPIEQIIAEVEAIGLLPEKQYAFGYVIGVVFGDGCISKETNRIPHTRSNGTVAYHDSTIYRVRLSVISQAFAERFASQWEVLTGKPTKVWSAIRTNFDKSTIKGRRKEGYRVHLFNVKQCHVLLTRYLKYLKSESELYELLGFSPTVMQGIIHGMIDSEGSVASRRRFDVSNMRVTLLDVLAIMLELLGYRTNVVNYPPRPIWHLVIYDLPYSKFALYDK